MTNKMSMSRFCLLFIFILWSPWHHTNLEHVQQSLLLYLQSLERLLLLDDLLAQVLQAREVVARNSSAKGGGEPLSIDTSRASAYTSQNVLCFYPISRLPCGEHACGRRLCYRGGTLQVCLALERGGILRTRQVCLSTDGEDKTANSVSAVGCACRLCRSGFLIVLYFF